MFIKFILSAVILFLSLEGVTQKNIDQIFRKYKNDEGVVNMNFTGEVLKMFNNSDSKIKSTVDVVDILVFQEKEDISSGDKSKILDVLTRDKFDLLVDVKNKSQKSSYMLWKVVNF